MHALVRVYIPYHTPYTHIITSSSARYNIIRCNSSRFVGRQTETTTHYNNIRIPLYIIRIGVGTHSSCCKNTRSSGHRASRVRRLQRVISVFIVRFALWHRCRSVYTKNNEYAQYAQKLHRYACVLGGRDDSKRVPAILYQINIQNKSEKYKTKISSSKKKSKTISIFRMF